MEETNKPKIEPLESSGLYTVELCKPLKEELDKIEVCAPKIEVKPCSPMEQAKCLPDIIPYLSGEGKAEIESLDQLMLGKKSCIPVCQPFTTQCQPQIECIPECQPFASQCQPKTVCIPECQPFAAQCQPKSACIPKCQPFVSPCQPTKTPCIPECQPFTKDPGISATGELASAKPDSSSIPDDRLQEIEESLKLIKKDIEEVKKKIAQESASRVSGEGYDPF
jgi:hypothetical protein